MFRRNETKLIVENWRKFINKNEKSLDLLNEEKDRQAEHDAIDLFSLSREVYNENSKIASLSDNEKYEESQNFFIEKLINKLNDKLPDEDKEIYNLLKRLLDRDHDLDVQSKVRKRYNTYGDDSNVRSLLIYFLQMKNTYSDFVLLKKRLQNMRTLDEVKKTLAQVKEQDIFKYNLGRTKEDGWFNNLLTFLKEKLEIDLEDEQVLSKEDFDRHFLAISAEFAEQCASKINKNYSVAGGIKEFIYEFLNKFYAFKK